MKTWDKYDDKKKMQLRNLQAAREDQWKEDLLVKESQVQFYNITPVNDVIDEWSAKMTDFCELYLQSTAEEDRMPDWILPLWSLGPARLSYITVRASMEAMYRSSILRDSNEATNKWNLSTAQTIARVIGDQAFDVARWLAAREQEPEYYRRQSQYFKNWSDRRRKAFANKVNAIHQMSQRKKDNFGHAMVRMAIESGLLVSHKTNEVTFSKGRTDKRFNWSLYVTLNGELMQHMMTRVQDYMDTLLPNRLPMVCRPIDHTHTETGGLVDWSLRKMRSTAKVKKASPDDFGDDDDNIRAVDPSCMSDMTINVINTLQSSEWRINTKVLEVVNDFWQANREVGTMPTREIADGLQMDTDYPELGTKTEQHEWLAEKSRKWAKWYKDANARLQMQLRMSEAYKLKSFVLWHAYFCDFRGRYYSDSYLLHPQGADLDKSLIMAAEPVDVTEKDIYWIKVNLANLMGVDKVSFDDRVEWVDSQMQMWRDIVIDPHGTLSLWEDDAPKKNATFQRLAAIFDLIMAIDEGKSQVPVQLDGACNGIQHWAAMTRDENIGPQVNLINSDKPADVYQLVADGCTDICIDHPNDWRNRFVEKYEGCIPRKVVKRSVMCDPYGITDHSVREYLMQEKHLVWVEDMSLSLKHAVHEMSTLICESKATQMAHCNNGKEFCKLVCGWASGNTDKPFSWQTPSGFKVVNQYNPKQSKQSWLKMWDKNFEISSEHHISFQYFSNEYDCDKAVQSMPPNFVHSLDAAHMSLCVDDLTSKGIEFFSMIHDSFGVMAPYVSMMRESIRETFYEIHKHDQLSLLQERAEKLMGEQLPDEHPAQRHQQRGSLDIRGCLESSYLFG